MDAGLQAKILTLLDEHRLMSLATLRPDGWPQTTTVGYVNEGLTLHFMCGAESQKAANLKRDNRVSLTIDHDTTDPMAISGLSMAARAYPVTDQAQMRRMLYEMLPKKYPEYQPAVGSVDLQGVAVFRVVPEVVSVLDYTKGFGHSDLVTVTRDETAA